MESVSNIPEEEADRNATESDKPRASVDRDSERDWYNPRLGNVLYRFAWVVEGIAIIAGLVISLMIALDAFDQVEATKGAVGFSDYVNFIAATIPFFLVAVVEATKIPVAGAAYQATTWTWRAIFSATLLFLAAITFETMLNGFERNFSNLTYVVTDLQKKKTTEAEQLELLRKEREEASILSAQSIEEFYNRRRRELAADRDSNAAGIQSQIAELKGTIQDQYTEALQDQLAALRAERDATVVRRRADLDRANRRIEEHLNARRASSTQERTAAINQVNRIGKLLEDKIRERDRAVQRANFLTRGSISESLDSQIDELRADRDLAQARLDAIDEKVQDEALARLQLHLRDLKTELDNELQGISRKIEQKGRQIAQAVSLKQKDIQPQLDRLYEELQLIEEKFTKQQDLNVAERARKVEQLRDRETVIASTTEEMQASRSRLLKVRDEINRQVAGNQVYRLALRFSSAESAADLSPTTVTWVAAIWFGSLATVVAFTGILLASASYVVSGPSGLEKKRGNANVPERQKLLRAARAALISIRRRARSPKRVFVDREVPKEVIKEVPVDKVRIHEVPREVLVKEVVHVPIYTNDPELLRTEPTELGEG
ncbi:MAG: hypothetical protein ACQGVK_24920 [Myxococcota bacterium]